MLQYTDLVIHNFDKSQLFLHDFNVFEILKSKLWSNVLYCRWLVTPVIWPVSSATKRWFDQKWQSIVCSSQISSRPKNEKILLLLQCFHVTNWWIKSRSVEIIFISFKMTFHNEWMTFVPPPVKISFFLKLLSYYLVNCFETSYNTIH